MISSVGPQFTFRCARLAPGAVVLLCAVPAYAQRLGQAPDDDISFVRVFAALLLCLAIAVGAAFALRARYSVGLPFQLNFRKANRLQLIENLRVGPLANLCIVKCDDQELLVEVSQQGSSILRQLSPPNSAEQP
jgi:flagellar biogenesis protein FliO